jgi:3-mercaptopyruvate sulfurtransferase SseA
MTFLCWLLRLFGMAKWAAALQGGVQGYQGEVKQEQDQELSTLKAAHAKVDEDAKTEKEKMDAMVNSGDSAGLSDRFNRGD